MAEVAGPSQDPVQNPEICEENTENAEPEKKKMKIEASSKEPDYNLEERLNGILCCTVCLDLPKSAVYQVSNEQLFFVYIWTFFQSHL